MTWALRRHRCIIIGRAHIPLWHMNYLKEFVNYLQEVQPLAAEQMYDLGNMTEVSRAQTFTEHREYYIIHRNRPRNTFVFLPLAAFKTVFHYRSKAAKHFKRRRYQIISDCKITSRKWEWAVYPLSHVHVCACVYMCIHMCKCTSMIAFSDHFAWRHKKVVVQCKKKNPFKF